MKLAPRSWYGKSGALLKGGLPSGKNSINLISFFNILMKFLFEKRVNDYFSHGKS